MPFVARFLAILIVILFNGTTNIGKVNLEEIRQKTERWLQYGFWISFLDETYLFLLVCASLNLRNYFERSAAGDAINSLLAVIFGILLVVFPIFVAFFYRTKTNFRKILERNPDFVARYGSVVEGLNFKRRYRWVLFYPCL